DHFLRGAPLPPSAMLLTFDDGYRNVGAHALPLLRRLGVPCVLFVVAGAIEAGQLPLSALPPAGGRLALAEPQGAAARDGYAVFDWAELAAAVRGGGVEIGSHTLTHPSLVECTPAGLTSELAGSRELIRKRLGIAVDAAAYPGGVW